jgi:hypothetical protein
MDEKLRTRWLSKPAEWRALNSGNTEDHFRVGIRITRGSIRYSGSSKIYCEDQSGLTFGVLGMCEVATKRDRFADMHFLFVINLIYVTVWITQTMHVLRQSQACLSKNNQCWLLSPLRLFADFFQSDVIVASPLALATKLEENDLAESDFLSSIELLIIDRADVMSCGQVKFDCPPPLGRTSDAQMHLSGIGITHLYHSWSEKILSFSCLRFGA